jgi:hypothetical protein
MKNAPEIWAKWDIGDFTGDSKPMGRVTVEPDWWLRLFSAGGSFDPSAEFPVQGLYPFRYYQNANGAVTPEIEVPNIKSITIDRSIDTDAATCTISIYNLIHNANGASSPGASVLGQPGYFTWNYGESAEAQSRWGISSNVWANRLTPNALLRTYQGYGGYVNGVPKSIGDAYGDGDIVLTGTWFVDDVSVSSDGLVVLKCRDAAKLLIEQIVYKPLVPDALYPLKFYRWKFENIDPIWDPGGSTSGAEVFDRPTGLTFSRALSDSYFGFNGEVYGHRPTDCLDGDRNTYTISAGYNDPSLLSSVDFWEFDISGDISQVYIDPWGGNYTMYISIMVNGVWQGTELIPAEPTLAGPTDVAIPWVVRTGVPYETPQWYGLPQNYVGATKLRISFREGMWTFLPPDHFRTGMKEITARSYGSESTAFYYYTFALAGHPDGGYWISTNTGQTFPFGTASALVPSNLYGVSSNIMASVSHPNGNGYWMVEDTGRVHSYGSSSWFGDPTQTVIGSDFVDIACTTSGNGYWVLRKDGAVFAFGDAVWYGNMATTPFNILYARDGYTATAIAAHPGGGYVVSNGHGEVAAFGPAGSHGGVVDRDGVMNVEAWVTAIEFTSSGNGYWILFGNGQVFTFGDAVKHGDGVPDTPPTFRSIFWDFMRSPDDGGYILLRADSQIQAFGNAVNYGSPSMEGQLRLEGNYSDYSQLVKLLLLWAGFYLEGTDGVHGNIESTGVYSEEALTEELFDKKTVMDCITQLKEIVGYLFWVDDEGGAHFESPNWWAPGNFYENGTRTSFIPDIDERSVLTSYSVKTDDSSIRSEIIITNYLPEALNANTVTTRFIPPSVGLLRGMVRPAMWANEVFTKPEEQQVMAELISLHTWFQQRQGSATFVGNPAIQINDQVRIWERTTGESYIHYVRGIQSSMDLDTGEYIMSLTTHWLGSASAWAISTPTSTVNASSDSYSLSAAAVERIRLTTSYLSDDSGEGVPYIDA